MWWRILFGNAPPAFLVEVVLRTVSVYAVLVLILRLLGKRMAGQLSLLEMGIMISIGAIVSTPMQFPDRGVSLALVLLLVILGLQRGLASLGSRRRHVELLMTGDVSALVRNGVVEVAGLRSAAMSHQQLYASLRAKGILHLGQVQRVYLEASGQLSTFVAERAKPGLSIVPDDDRPMAERQQAAAGLVACQSCGCVTEQRCCEDRCHGCGATSWTRAVT